MISVISVIFVISGVGRGDAAPGDLADGSRRQHGHDPVRIGDLEGSQRLREQVPPQLATVQRCGALVRAPVVARLGFDPCRPVAARDDVGDETLAEQFVGLADDARVVHAGVAQQGVFDLGRSDLLPAAIDLLLGPADDRDAPGLVASHQITGPIEAVGGEGGLLAWPGEVVPADRVGPAHLQFADLVQIDLADAGRGGRAGLGVRLLDGDHSDLVERRHRASLGRDDRLEVVGRARVADEALGHAVDLLEQAELGVDPPGHAR